MVRNIVKDTQELLKNARKTFLSATAASAATTLTVQSIKEFAIKQILLIGELGYEQSEIVKTHASTAPTGSTITLAAAITFNHPIDTPVYVIDYDQVEFAHAATATGTKTVLSKESIDADADETIYKDKAKLSGYYFTRYYNSTTSDFTAAITDIITCNSHGLSDGEVIALTSTTTIPAGLSATVCYYVIDSATNTFKVSLTSGGDAVDITDIGTGTHSWGRCSLYSDAEPYANFASNTVWAIKQRALDELGEKISSNLTHDWLNERLWSARRLVHRKRKRWSWGQAFNYDLGNVTSGDYRIAVPTDLQDKNTNKNILAIRIGTSSNLEYQTKKEHDDDWQGVAQTTLAADYAITDGTVTLTDSRDFPESGSITFGDGDTVQYSANVESTGVLTVSGAGESAHTSGDNAYNNVSLTLPTKYTVWNEYIYFNYPISSDYADENYWIDYYKELTAYDSEGDELDEPEYDFYVHYLKWAIKHKKSQGKLKITTDADGELFSDGLSDLIRKEILGQDIQIMPDIEHLEQ